MKPRAAKRRAGARLGGGRAAIAIASAKATASTSAHGARRSGAARGVREDAREGGERGEAVDVSAWVRLLACHNLILAEVRRRLAAECTMPRFDLLANLEREDGQTLAALSRRMLVTAGNLTGLVDRAARDGVVVRRSDPRDGRVSRVYLTPKGRALATHLLPMHARHVAALLGGLGEADRRTLRRLLGRLRGSLDARGRGGQLAHAPETEAP